MIDFPTNPQVGDQFTSAGNTWEWDGVKWIGVGVAFLPLAGGTMLGELELAADPVDPLEAATKEYVDASVDVLIGIPVGGMIMWPGDPSFGAGGGVPADFLLCNGGYYNPADAPALFNVIGGGWGWDGTNFAVPNMLDRVAVGAGNSWGITAAGGEINHVLDGNELTYHAHGVADPGHAHSLYDPGHNHVFSDPGHVHGIGDPGHAHGGTVRPGGTFSLGSPGWTTQSSNTDAAGTGVYVGGAGTGAWNNAAVTSMGVYAAGTGIGIYAAGASWGHNNMQPFVAMNYIIRYQ